MRAMVLLVWLAGCIGTPDSVAMTGTVFDSADATAALPGATLRVWDARGAAFSDATADGDGQFSVDVPRGAFFMLVVTGAGAAPTSFQGTASVTDFAVDDGTFWAMSQEARDALQALWSGCPGADGQGTTITGDVRLYGYNPDDPLAVTTAAVKARGAASPTWSGACYLDDAGAYSADAAATGETGSFALFGLPAGVITVRLNYTVGTATSDDYTWRFYVPEGGVAPLYPAWVNLL